MAYKEKSRFLITGYAYGENISESKIEIYYIYEVNSDNFNILGKASSDFKTIEDLKKDLLSKYKLS